MSAHTVTAHRAHGLPQGETAAHTAAHRSAETLPQRPQAYARAREGWTAIHIGIRAALSLGMLAVLIGFAVLALYPATWVASGLAAAVGILTLAITASVWTGRQP